MLEINVGFEMEILIIKQKIPKQFEPKKKKSLLVVYIKETTVGRASSWGRHLRR